MPSRSASTTAGPPIYRVGGDFRNALSRQFFAESGRRRTLRHIARSIARRGNARTAVPTRRTEPSLKLPSRTRMPACANYSCRSFALLKRWKTTRSRVEPPRGVSPSCRASVAKSSVKLSKQENSCRAIQIRHSDGRFSRFSSTDHCFQDGLCIVTSLVIWTYVLHRIGPAPPLQPWTSLAD